MQFRHDSPVTINDRNIERIFEFQLPVMLFFWQNFLQLAPVNDELLRIAREKAGRLIVAKINASQNQDGSRIFNVEDTPLLFGLKDGFELPRFPAHQQEFIRAYASFVLNEGPLPPHGSLTNAPSLKTPAALTNLTDASFEQQILLSDMPVLVDFWASWCIPCHAISPLLRHLARELEGVIRVVRIDVDNNPHYAGIYDVQDIPTLILFNDSHPIARIKGVPSLPQLRQFIRKNLFS